MIKRVELPRKLQKELKRPKRIPVDVMQTLLEWVELVRTYGLHEVRKDKSWHDEPMQGDQKGQRKIYLDYQWRAIYIIKKDAEIEFVSIEKVTPHEYRH